MARIRTRRVKPSNPLIVFNCPYECRCYKFRSIAALNRHIGKVHPDRDQVKPKHAIPIY